MQVAEAIGPKRLLPELGDAATKTAAAGTISSGLEVLTTKGSDIIFVSYKNKDPQLATLVLDELVSRYFTKHLEVHRSAAAFDFVTEQSDQVRARFRRWDNVTVTQGKVPQVLADVVPDRIAFLHIDMNNAEAERGALEVLFDRVSPGGMIVLDDYGWLLYRAQKDSADDFMRSRGLHVLELPTGQGLVVKR